MTDYLADSLVVTPHGKGFIQNIETNRFIVGKKEYAII